MWVATQDNIYFVDGLHGSILRVTEFFSGTTGTLDPREVIHAVEVYPARVLPFVDLEVQPVVQHARLAANPPKNKRYSAESIPIIRHRFPHRLGEFPEGTISGYYNAQKQIDVLRKPRGLPHPEIIATFAMFAAVSIQVGIEATEKFFDEHGTDLNLHAADEAISLALKRSQLGLDNEIKPVQLQNIRNWVVPFYEHVGRLVQAPPKEWGKGRVADRALRNYVATGIWPPYFRRYHAVFKRILWNKEAKESRETWLRAGRKLAGEQPKLLPPRAYSDWVGLPKFLGLTKLSFLMMFLGFDSACLDRRLLFYWAKGDRNTQSSYEEAIKEKSEADVEEGPGDAIRVRPRPTAIYHEMENWLEDRPEFRENTSYAQAQWMLWERLKGPPIKVDAKGRGRMKPDLREHKVVFDIIERKRTAGFFT